MMYATTRDFSELHPRLTPAKVLVDPGYSVIEPLQGVRVVLTINGRAGWTPCLDL